MDNAVLHKIKTIENALKRIQDVYADAPNLLEDYTKLDSIIMNIQRTCEASIDLSMYLVRANKLGIPKSRRDGFRFLKEAHLIDVSLVISLINMIEFCRVAIHDDQAIDLNNLRKIVDHQLEDFLTFTRKVIQLED
ncbi:type VII toxin-antitoxin system HepT family RNase toxin [Exiguobacterium acetylicum]|uniref:type VII toxin-antitoxin system HepT family RNase toxin n=1 Tax=Exiguobacterium acetylicum TaxID=41170 RepID=UPI001EE2678E|nr:DUF86 domain-containing protein [Exiguobacterium acetylicum]UKS56407.1 DUF86 domain-containing protein [Exiguobacterium acetylicum]